MGSSSSEAKGRVLCVVSMVTWSCLSLVAQASDFNDFDINWGDGRAKILDSGELLALSLDKDSGSGFQSKDQYLFGKVDMQSDRTSWDEIDFEFLANLSGEPYVMHTNVYTQGKDFAVDNTPIREFRNLESKGVAFPKSQPMRLHSTLWNADNWATRGGLVKTDWTQAPFTASYRNFSSEAYVWASGSSPCGPMGQPSWFTAKMDADGQVKMKSVQKDYMIYNYCTDTKRFPSGFAPECAVM